MNQYNKDRITDGVVAYLRSRAKAEMGATEYHPEASLLSKAADMIEDLSAKLSEAKSRNVSLQRTIGEYEAREIGGNA
jgi:hypothetical protein